MTPIRKNILFKPFMGDAVSEGGILVPDAYRKESDRGEIVAVGNLVTKVKAGDVGHRVKAWGTEILIDGTKHYIMDESAIIALQ